MGKKVFVDLSHPFFGDMPLWPYFSKPEIAPMHSMAKGGVLTQTIKCTMHTGTHADAPRHVMERMFDGRRAIYSHELPVDAYCGDAVCLDVQVDRWKLIMPKDLEDAVARAGMKPAELEGHGGLPEHRHAPQVRRQQGVLPLLARHRHRCRQVVREAQGEGRGHGPAGAGSPAAHLHGQQRHAHEARGLHRQVDLRRVHRAVRRRSLCRVRQGRLHQGPRQGEVRREVRRAGSHRLLRHLGALPQDHAGPRHRRRREPGRRSGQGEGQALPLLRPARSAGTWATAPWSAALPRSTKSELVPAEPRLYKYGAM